MIGVKKNRYMYICEKFEKMLRAGKKHEKGHIYERKIA